ncbi:hypothetical protein F5Y10DRAFT_267975 [Nemania abortiva]|nr:hypothetical protein F5Y10DRAFT_267975 [Nemania abortiva]
MTFTINAYDSDGKGDSEENILQKLRDMIERSDPRGSYYIEPTWRINGVSISQRTSPNRPEMLSRTRFPRLKIPLRPRTTDFKHLLRGLSRSELREIIMNFCLKSIDTHKDVIDILKRMQTKKPRPISLRSHVQNPTVGLYLYCRTQRELVEIILEISSYDETGYFKQDVRDLVMVMKEKE